MLLLTLQDIFDAALSLILIIDCKHYDYPHKMVYWGLYFINEATIKRKMIFLNFWKKFGFVPSRNIHYDAPISSSPCFTYNLHLTS